MEKTLKILEGILDRHYSRKNALLLLNIGNRDWFLALTKEMQEKTAARLCECEECAALEKAVKRLKKTVSNETQTQKT